MRNLSISARKVVLIALLIATVGSSRNCSCDDVAVSRSMYMHYASTSGWISDPKRYPDQSVAFSTFSNLKEEESDRVAAAEHFCVSHDAVTPEQVKSASLIARAATESITIRLMAIQIVAKGLDSEDTSDESESIMFELARDPSVASLIRSHSLALLAFISDRWPVVQRDILKMIVSPQITDDEARGLLRYARLAVRPFKKTSDECLANMVLSAYRSDLTIGRRTVLIESLSECMDGLGGLSNRTLMDIDSIAQSELVNRDNETGFRYLAFTITLSDVELPNESGIAIDELLRDPKMTPHQKEMLLRFRNTSIKRSGGTTDETPQPDEK